MVDSKLRTRLLNLFIYEIGMTNFNLKTGKNANISKCSKTAQKSK